MLSGLFQYDNPVWKFIGKLFDIFILNLLWMICSIPIVTIGASTTAVYYVTMHLVEDDYGNTIEKFFHAFRQNFIQSTIIWGIMAASGIFLAADLLLIFRIQLPSLWFQHLIIAVLLLLTFIWTAAFLFVFPLQSRFYNPVSRTLINAVFLSMKHLPTTISLLILDAVLPVLAFFVTARLQPILLMFGFPLSAFINSYYLLRVFQLYVPSNSEDAFSRHSANGEEEPEDDLSDDSE